MFMNLCVKTSGPSMVTKFKHTSRASGSGPYGSWAGCRGAASGGTCRGGGGARALAQRQSVTPNTPFKAKPAASDMSRNENRIPPSPPPSRIMPRSREG